MTIDFPWDFRNTKEDTWYEKVGSSQSNPGIKKQGEPN